MMRDALYGGVNAAVLTAMRPDLSIDVERTAAHCLWLLSHGCDGLGVLGTTGEANSLGLDERVVLLESLAAHGVPPRRMLPGCGTSAVPDTVLLVRRAAALGCSGVLLLPPFFYKDPSEDGLFAYFSEVIERSGGEAKVYLYHFPRQSAVPIGLGLVGRLRRAYPGVVRGIKDSSGDYANTRAYIDHYAADGFEVYCADDSHLRAVLGAGGAGCITAAANVGSMTSARVYAEAEEAAGEAAQATLSAIRRAVTSDALIPGLKALVARHRGEPGWAQVRPPHMPLDEAAAARLFAAFDACGAPLAPAG